jgi:tetratricopeptide (TPR) repeat protein
MNDRKEFKHAVRLYEESVCADAEKKVQLVGEAVALLQKCVADAPDDAEYAYALGLCWYDYPEPNPARSSNVEKFLKRALELSPGHQFALLYLGHLYFDERRYREALERFESVSPDFFEKLDQQWRVLKLEELILCCRLYLHPQEVASKDVDSLCQTYEAVGSINAPVPVEIVNCFGHLCESRSAHLSRYSGMVMRVLRMIRRLDFEEALKSNVERLKECFSL